MINGKFFTGLPPNMIDRSKGLNRQQTNFFWPDDSQNQSAVESRVKRRSSIQAENRSAYVHRPEQSNSDAENKERFKKEFTKSSIQFNDNVEQQPRRNRQKITSPPQHMQKPQNVQPHVSTRGKPESYTSRIEFYDFAEDLNNVPRTDKNNKVEVERNTKNSPKLQNKHLSFDPPDEAVNFIENDVRNMKITAPPRRRNTVRDNRPRYARPLANDSQNYSDYNEDYHSPRRLPLPQPPVRSRYPESNPDFEEYSPRRLGVTPRATYDGIDGPIGRSRRQDLYDDETVSTRKIGRQVHFSYTSGIEHNAMTVDQSQDYHDMAPPPQQTTRKVNILKVDNDFRNNEHRTAPYESSSPQPTSPTAGASHKHLMSNICFSDTESTTTPTPPCPPRRNIRSSAVNRVSVGLPD